MGTQRNDSRSDQRAEQGSAAPEQIGLILMVSLLMLAAIVAVAAHGPIDEGRKLASLLGRRLACAPLASTPCRQDRLKTAYGEPLARLTRALAPAPADLLEGGLTAVDFRRCRRPSCAVPVAGPRGERLTTSNRRITAFTEVRDRRRQDGSIEVVYWLYRPGRPWQAIVRHAGRAELEAAGSTRLGRDESPILVPLETLPGRNHLSFRRIEEPPWRWRVNSTFPGRPS